MKRGNVAAMTLVMAALMGCPQSATPDEFQQGMELLAAGQNDKAGQEFKKVIQKKPEFPEGHLMLGQVYMNLGAMTEAEDALQKGVDLLEKEKKTVIQDSTWEKLAAKAYQDMAKVEIRRAANNIDPAKVAEKQAAGEKAIKFLSRVVELDPDNAAAKQKLEEVKKAYAK